MRLAALLLCLAASPRAARAVEWSSVIGLASDYAYRGVSQSRGEPAVQAGVTAAWTTGWYAAAWASSVDFGPGDEASVELDAQGGWNGRVGGPWTLDVALAAYLYPGESGTNYGELLARAERGERLILAAGWSDDALATGGSGLFTAAGMRFTLRRGWSLEALLGHSAIGRLPGDGYSHVEVHLSRSWGRFELDVSGHATSSTGRDAFGDEADPRLVLALAWSLPADR